MNLKQILREIPSRRVWCYIIGIGGAMVSFRLDSDATNKIIRISFEDEETCQVLRDAQAALRSCWERLGPWPCIVDLTGVTEATFPSEDVRTIARIQPVV